MEQIRRPHVNEAPENDDEILERERDDSLDEVVMAIDFKDRGTLGCAYFIARDETLHMMEDITNGAHELIESCKYCLNWAPRFSMHTHSVHEVKVFIQPTVLLLSSKADENIESLLKPSGAGEESHREERPYFSFPFYKFLTSSGSSTRVSSLLYCGYSSIFRVWLRCSKGKACRFLLGSQQ